MKTTFGRLVAALGALALATGVAAAQSKPKVTIAVGGAGCLCYLPTVLAKQLGEYEKAGVEVELIDFKGGSQALQAVIGGSADVVSGYFDHCVNLAAKNQALQAFVVYDRYPGMVLVVSPEAKDIKSIKDLAGKAVGVWAPGSSTDFFLKYLLAKNGVDPTRHRASSASALPRPRSPRWSRARSSRRHARSGRDAAAEQVQGPADPERHAHRRRTRSTCSAASIRAARSTPAPTGSPRTKDDAEADQRDRRHAEVDPLAHAGRDHGEDAGRAGRRRTRRSISRR